jgi:hypothetical protein
MKVLSCAAVSRRLQAFHDRELPVAEQISVESHVERCAECAVELSLLQDLGHALRVGAAFRAPTPDELHDVENLQVSVVGRMKAERDEELGSRMGRLFEDMHLVWAGLCATGATAVCALLLFGIGYFAVPERADSLAGILTAQSQPGSNRNPVSVDQRMRLPRVDDSGVDLLARSKDEDVVLALAAVVTQEGRISNPEVLLTEQQGREDLSRLMTTVMEVRFQPASYAGSPVAVNLVWLLTHTTVRGKLQSS